MDTSLPENEFRIRFDGRMLKLELADEMVGAPATGPDAWPCRYRVTVTPRLALPRRLRTDPVEVGIWDSMLEIEGYRFRVTEA
jgi:hypothetical protein